MRSLIGKRVLITGAGNGLGRELALAFADVGAEVVVTDISCDGIARTAELVHAAGGRVICLRMDVTDADNVLDVRRQLHQQHGPIDVLVNNAGIVRVGRFLETTLQSHYNTLNANTLGPMIVTHAFLPDLISRPEGNCVNIVSAAGMIPMPNSVTYAASKWATLGFSDSLREELRCLGHRHVRVTAVCPGFIDTGMFARARQPRFMPRLGVSRLAQQIVRAVQANKSYLLTPWLVNLVPLCRAILPLPVGQWLVDWLGVSTALQDLTGTRSPTTSSDHAGLAPAPSSDPFIAPSASKTTPFSGWAANNQTHNP